MATEEPIPTLGASGSNGQQSVALPSLIPPTCEPPPEPRWARRLRWSAPIGPLVTMVILTVSAIFASLVYSEARDQNVAQRKAAQSQQTLLRQSIDQNTIATIYTMGMELQKILMQYPELRIYFDANLDPRTPPRKEDDAQRRDRLNKQFDKESNATQQRVWQYCEALADFFEYTYALRDLLPESDWNGWWTYFSDAYEESHFLKIFMTSRPGWYTINDVLALPKAQRDAWYLKDKTRIAQQNAKKN